jgi:predicted transcriptional regulator
MSHPMVEEALECFYPRAEEIYRHTLIAQTSENTLIDILERMEENIDFSSLPMMNAGNPIVEISVASMDYESSIRNFNLFIDALNKKSIVYEIMDNNNK